MRKIVGGTIFLLVLAVAVFALQGNVAHVQPLHDHFKSYRVADLPLPAPIDVVLKDQFGLHIFAVLENEYLCVPSEKRIKPSEPCGS